MTTASLTNSLRQEAQRLGFTMAGVCPAVTPSGVGKLGEWLAEGMAGEMHYLAKREAAYHHPRYVLDGCRSILMLAMNYRTVDPELPSPEQGRISRYAWGNDYHDLLRDRLNQLADFLKTLHPESNARGVVDTAPLLEREFAQMAGLGWVGKNTLLLNRTDGSWFFLAALLTDLELEYDVPFETDHCGSCTACLDSCPTDAFFAPYVLDSRKCISYLTIELKDAIPEELRTGLGDWLFGCDICQDVCPWNRKAPLSQEASFRPPEGVNPVDLAELFELDDEAFRQRFRSTPLWRPKRRGLLRNAAILLGSRPEGVAVPPLLKAIVDNEPLVRGAAAWALGQFDSPRAVAALKSQQVLEADENVRLEIEAGLRS